MARDGAGWVPPELRRRRAPATAPPAGAAAARGGARARADPRLLSWEELLKAEPAFAWLVRETGQAAVLAYSEAWRSGEQGKVLAKMAQCRESGRLKEVEGYLKEEAGDAAHSPPRRKAGGEAPGTVCAATAKKRARAGGGGGADVGVATRPRKERAPAPGPASGGQDEGIRGLLLADQKKRRAELLERHRKEVEEFDRACTRDAGPGFADCAFVVAERKRLKREALDDGNVCVYCETALRTEACQMCEKLLKCSSCKWDGSCVSCQGFCSECTEDITICSDCGICSGCSEDGCCKRHRMRYCGCFEGEERSPW